MYNFILNENEKISLDKKTILSCMFLCNSNDIINNDDINDDLSVKIFNLPLEFISFEDKTNYINHNVIRLIILNGLKEKIEKELSNYAC